MSNSIPAHGGGVADTPSGSNAPLNAAVVSTHWHVKIEGVDTELFTGDTLFAALEYAGAELNSLADWLHDGVSVAGDAGLTKLAYSRFQLSFTYWGLAEEATTVVNHYHHHAQGAQGAELLDTADLVVSAINAGTPEGFAIYACPLDECAPTDEEGK